MKKLTLQRLALENFKGQTFTLETQGKNVDVFGDNATGKTTLYDALCWLLFNKDSSFKSDFEIKTLNSDGSAEHNIEHTVKGLFRWEGKVIELKKVYAEIWTKKRGSARKEFTGHTTDHFIDSVPKSKREYQDYVSGISTEDQFKLLTSPFYFSEKMKWQDRRTLLMSLVGDITDGEVIDSMASLQNKESISNLTNIINTRSIEDHKKVIAARRREINDHLEKIPVRIDEVVKGMPDITGISHLAEIDKINKWSKELESIDAKISALQHTGALAELQNDLAKVETEIITTTNTVTQKYNADRQVTQNKVSALKDKLADLDATVINNRHSIKMREKEKEFVESVLVGLRNEWDELKKKDKEFKESIVRGQCTCAICGDVHNLPADKIESMTALHNETLSLDKASNSRTGLARKKDLEDFDAKIASLLAANEAIEKEEAPIAEEISRLEASLRDDDNSILGLMIDADASIADARTRKDLIEKRIQMERDGNADDGKLSVLQNEKEELQKTIKAAQERIALVESVQKSQDRKAELEKEQRAVAAEFEKLEGELFLMDEFTRAKVGMVEDKINGMFSLARFRMFENNINGGLQECCKVTYNGIPFETSLNNGARINVGLDIINTISRINDLSLPIVVDNAESVTNLLPIDTQVIRLIVSEQDKTLRLSLAA